MQIENIEDISLPSRYDNPWAFPTVAAVGPNGEFVWRHFNSKQAEIGDVPIRSMDGRPVLSPRYAEAGWCLYSDVCTGNVRGVEESADAWTRWQNLIKARAAGRHPPRGSLGEDFFHPEVGRRRAAAAAGGGAGTLSAAELRVLFPGVEIHEPEHAVGVPATVRGPKPKLEQPEPEKAKAAS